MYVNFLLKLKYSGDLCFSQIFFNYSIFCNFTYFLNFFIEFFLFIYIIYSFIFYKESRQNFKIFFFQYIFFLIFLVFISYTYFFFFDNCFNIIGLHLLNNQYIICCKLFILILLIFILFISKNKFIEQPITISLNEVPCILTFLILFICILFSTLDLFIMYLTIEGISLILYTLGSLMNQSLINMEAIIKYFLVNNIASSLLLWSISYLYLLTGTTDSFELQYLLISSLETIITENLYYISFILITSLFFKLALFPFQWWIADIYDGLWTPITLLYAVLIKITFFLFFFKLILSVFYSIIFLFQPFLWICALGSIIIGSLGALAQVKIKRFLAYTSIAQSGYIILGLSCNSLNGSISSFLYLFMYCLITLSFFSILLNIEHSNKGHNLTYLNQLYSLILYNKEISFHIIVIILVMAAIPPFSSFFAKFLILIVSIESKLEFITIILLIFTLISTFYYLNFIQQLIFFKVNNPKIFIFRENLILFYFLRLNTLFFSFTFFILAYIFEISWFLLISCLWPLSFY